MPTDSTVPPAAASGLRMIDRAALQALLDTTVADELVPGAVVLLRRPQGEVTAAAGTVERGVERPPDIDTHFRIASNTKTMTAAVIMQLAHEGKLQLDDPVSTYVADVPDGGRITIDQLLKMRSGLYNYTNSPTLTTTLDDDPTKVWTPPELLAIAFAQPPSSAPGAGYEYNNTNYVLLGLIIEKAGGRSLDTAFRERLFEPLGMHDTELPAGDSNHIPDPFARGYMYGSSSVAMYDSPVYTPEQVAAAEAGTLEPKDYTDVNHSFAWAPGGVTSTARDLATWIEALVGGRVLDAASQRLWLDSPQWRDPADPLGVSYGYGILRQEVGSNTFLLHEGETVGYNSSMLRDAGNDMTLVVWTNLAVDLQMRPAANQLMRKVIELIYEQAPITDGDLSATG
jgi:D-alanyl-D-alanine carboxypeptidase